MPISVRHFPPSSLHSEGNTALILASMGRKSEVVQALLAAGADVNAKGNYGGTALIGVLQGTSREDIKVAINSFVTRNGRDLYRSICLS